LRNELEGRNKFEKGDRGGLQRSRNRGGVFGSKVRKQNHPFRVPSSCSSLSTVAFGHHHPAPSFRHHQRCHQQQQRRNRNKTEKEKEQERERAETERKQSAEEGRPPSSSAKPSSAPPARLLCLCTKGRRTTAEESPSAATHREQTPRATVGPPPLPPPLPPIVASVATTPGNFPPSPVVFQLLIFICMQNVSNSHSAANED